MRFLLAAALLALLMGCAETHPNTRVVFQNATINGHPAHLVFDSGTPVLTIFDFEARDAGLKMALKAPPPLPYSETTSLSLSVPGEIKLSDYSFTGQMVVANPPSNAILITGDGTRFDGLVGWGEMKDNILVFDGAQHHVASVAELPAGVEKWTSFKIGDDWHLTLKTPQPNGQMGTILIDTGMFAGVALPPKQWQEWRAAHPNAPSGFLIYLSPGSGEVRVEEAWADEITLGSLTLYDVPVHQADPNEIRIDPKNYAGTIQLFGLSRLDFVVDGKRGVAYVRPKLPPASFYPAISRPGVSKDPAAVPIERDWVIDGPLTLNPQRLRYMSAGVLAMEAVRQFKEGDTAGALETLDRAIQYDANNDLSYYCRSLIRQLQHDSAGAMADLNRALQINPGNIFASYDRARARDAAGDHGGALSDYSDVIAGDARFAPAYLGRGLDRHAQNDISGAVADYEEYLASYPDAEQPQLYREILRRWTGAPPRDLTADTVKWKDDWARGLGKYISGSLSEADLRALAATGPEAAARVCVAEYFTGLMHFLNHDLAGARTRWEKCVSLNATVPEVRFAQSALSFLNSVPAP